MDGKKVLIIDDNQSLLEALSVALSAHGFRVITAKSAEEGRSKIDEVKPDIVVCDIMMEEVDSGLKVAEELCKKNPHLPKIMMSNIADATALNTDVFQYGFKYIMQKPVDPDALIKKINQLCSGE